MKNIFFPWIKNEKISNPKRIIINYEDEYFSRTVCEKKMMKMNIILS